MKNPSARKIAHNFNFFLAQNLKIWHNLKKKGEKTMGQFDNFLKILEKTSDRFFGAKTSEKAKNEKIETFINDIENKPLIVQAGKTHNMMFGIYFEYKDSIELFNSKKYHNPFHHYKVLFHELGHATGHRNRLNRNSIIYSRYSSIVDRTREEIIADIISLFFCLKFDIFWPSFLAIKRNIDFLNNENKIKQIPQYISNLSKTDKFTYTKDDLFEDYTEAIKATKYILGE